MGPFNPYQHWLEIPESKPDYYRLLGLNRFESDSAKISASAEAQLARLRSASPGEFVEQWCELVNELALAMKCLTDEAARKAYDQQLRASLQQRTAVPGTAAKAPSSKASPKAAPPKPIRNQEDDDEEELPPMAHPDPSAEGSVSSNPYSLPVPGATRPAAWPESAQPFAPPPPGAVAPPWVPPPAVSLPPGQPALEAPATPAFAKRDTRFDPTAKEDFPIPAGAATTSATAMVLEARQRQMRFLLVSAGSLAAVILVGFAIFAMNNSRIGQIAKSNVIPSPATPSPEVDSQGATQSPQPTTAVVEEAEETPPEPKMERMPKEKPRQRTRERMKVSQRKEQSKTSEQPAEKQPPKPAPAPSASPPPEPAPQPKPETVEPTPQQLAEFRGALLEVHKLLGDREFDAAKQQLAAAEALIRGEKLQEQWERMKLLDHYVNEFWNAVQDGIKQQEGGSELKINNTIVAVVEARPTYLILRVAGKNIRYSIPKELKTPIAIEIANTWFDDRPENKVFLGAFQAVDPRGDLQEAKRLWQEAEKSGVNVQALLTLADELSQTGK